MPQDAISSADVRVLVVNVAGAELTLLSSGVLWWAHERLLVVSDLHLEKGSAYAARGQMTPPYDTRDTLQRLSALIASLAPVRVISLGDSFHDKRARGRMASDDVERVRSLTAACDWVWIEGNHDPAPPDDLGGRRVPEIQIGGIRFRHEPGEGVAVGEVCGHFHPCARVAGRGRTVRSACFVTDGTRLVMPAFGALTGGLNVLDPVFDTLFPEGFSVCTLGRDGVYQVSPRRLAPDGARSSFAAG